MARLLFKPFSILGGLLGGLVAKRLFDALWALIEEEEPPDGSERRVPWPKLILAAALQGAIFRAVRVAADRGARRAFLTFTGTWPGEEEPEQE